MGKFYYHSWFGLLMALYVFARLIRWKYPDAFPLFSSYFTDVLFVPAMCCFALIFTRMIKRDPNLKVKWHIVVFVTVLISYYFEFYLPFQPANVYISDSFDVVCYFIGAILFLILQHLEPSKKRINQ